MDPLLHVYLVSSECRWCTDVSNVLPCCLPQVLVSAGAHVTGEALRSLLILITNTPKLQGYAARSLHRALVSNFDKAEVPLVLAAVWCAGEVRPVPCVALTRLCRSHTLIVYLAVLVVGALVLGAVWCAGEARAACCSSFCF